MIIGRELSSQEILTYLRRGPCLLVAINFFTSFSYPRSPLFFFSHQLSEQGKVNVSNLSNI